MLPISPRAVRIGGVGAIALFGLMACGDGDDPVASAGTGQIGSQVCELDSSFLIRGAARDGIPSLDDPIFVSADVEVPGYLDPDTRVIGFMVDDDAYAVPHNVLWFHEIVNLNLTVTENGITDSDTGSRWSVEGRAIAGPMQGEQLEPLRDAYVAFWGAWAAFHPGTELWEG